MIGWEEIAETSIPDDVIVQVWRTSNATASATGRGNPVSVSAGYYLDGFGQPHLTIRSILSISAHRG
jgi:hypothetical protein